MFEAVSTKLDFPQLEEKVLAFWQANRIFQKSIEARETNPPFVFLEGPPFANARPGVHHVLARIMKDAVCRYKTMTGHYVRRKAGWDTHGLPVEYQVEKELNIRNKQELEAYGVEKFIEKCKDNVFKYEKDWRRLTERIGFWVDLDDPYITLSNNYIESIWWVLGQAWQKKLLYQGHKVQPYCPRCGTTLASHEVAQGYKTVSDPSIYVRFRVKGKENTYFLVWTTTPWTLPSNVALAVGEAYDYVSVEHEGECLILAKELVSTVFGDVHPPIKANYKGKDFVGWEYERLFDFAQHEEKAYYVVLADFVTLTDGTGLVHIAPAFGQDDYEIGQKYSLPLVQLVDSGGAFVPAVKPWAGEFVKDVDTKIIRYLREIGVLFKQAEYEHEYPFCWRCDTPLLYYARESWFIRTTALRDRLLAFNKEVNWAPAHIKAGRFGNWLENNIDWALSRERYWGTPLPVWVCEACGDQHVVSSIEELKERGKEVPDDIELHRPYIDAIQLSCEACNGTMWRIPDVIDCWFDSGCAHTAQWHYPFENKELFEQNYPADFVSEGIDQTRGWFYSLLVTGTLLYDKPAYRNCLCLELILGPDGQKMSKSRGNTVDSWQVLNKQGADAMRWHLFAACPPWTPRAFKEADVDEALKKFMSTVYNVYGFFVMYANLADTNVLERESSMANRSLMDRWIVSRLHTLNVTVRTEMENYRPTTATRAIAEFVDDLSNWYVRRSRDRFWGTEELVDQQFAYMTLYEVLVTVAKLLAPFTPFLAEAIFRNLVCSLDSSAPESVHLAEYPMPNALMIDRKLEEDMQLVRDLIGLGRAARNRSGIKTRQPLGVITLGGLSGVQKDTINRFADLVGDELNVKEIVFRDQIDQFVSVVVKPNFKTLGRKYGKGVQDIAKGLSAANGVVLKGELEANGTLRVEFDETTYVLEVDDVEVSSQERNDYAVEVDGPRFVALSTSLTPELILEGFARELVNKIQQMRKEADFSVSDRISVSLTSTRTVHEAFNAHRDYITRETLTDAIIEIPSANAFIKTQKVNGERATIGIEQLRSDCVVEAH